MVMRDEGPSDYVARNADIRIGTSRVGGDFGITVSETGARFHDTHLTFAGVDTRLIEQIVPGVDCPASRNARRPRIARRNDERDGRRRRRHVRRRAVRRAAASIARGMLGFGNGEVRARNLRMRLAPVQVDLARIAMPDLPIGGVVTGTATLNGSTTDAARRHRRSRARRAPRGGPPARSHLTGRGVVAMRGATWMDLDLRARPLSLVTVGRFVPALGLRGSAAGPIRVRGSLNDLSVRADLRLPDGGELLAVARLDVQGTPRYDAQATLRVFNLHTVAAALPRTSLSGVAPARGTGADLRTMRATLAADLRASAIDSVSFDSARVRVAIADGLATVQPAIVSTSFARADIRGHVRPRRGTGRRAVVPRHASIRCQASRAGFRRKTPRRSRRVQDAE